MAWATKALAIASRSFNGRPTHPPLLGTKRANGIISKVATRRLADSVHSPTSSSKTGKSFVWTTCANCMICCRSVSFIWHPRNRYAKQQINSKQTGLKHNQAVLFDISDLAQFCKWLFEVVTVYRPTQTFPKFLRKQLKTSRLAGNRITYMGSNLWEAR
jgi:hypothetical protein